jgi:uncharacterized membrane protein YcaP (DUF421 family)
MEPVSPYAQVPDAQIPEDGVFQRRMIWFERLAWIVIAAGLVTTAAGLWGGQLAAAVGRSAILYFFLLLIVRVSGKRTLAQATPFDLLLLLLLSDACQQGLVGDDYSVTTAIVVVTTLVGLDIALGLIKQRSKTADKLLDDVPTIIVEHGRPLEERMNLLRVDVEDVLEAARRTRGIHRLDQIRYAVLERDGHISVIPEAGCSHDDWHAGCNPREAPQDSLQSSAKHH